MKKILSVVLAMAMVLSLAACGSQAAPAPAPAADAKSEAPAPAAEEKSEAPAAEAESEAPAADDVDKSDWVELNLDYATFLAQDAPGHDGLTIFKEALDKEMGGDYVNIEVYGNSTLLGITDICEGVENGTAGLGLVMISVETGRFPVTQVAEIAGPYYASTRAGSHAFREYLQEVQPAELSDAGLIPLFPIAQVPMAICSTKPITSMEDLKGLQIRATGAAADAVTAWGAVPVSMALSEVYEALRNGLVDGACSSVGAFGNSMFQEVADYCTIVPYIGYSCVVMMNKDMYESMPESQRAAFDRAADTAFEEFYSTYLERLYNDPNTENYINAIKEKEGVTWLSDEEYAKLEEAVKPCIDAYKATLNDQGLDGDALVDQYLALLDKWNAEYPPKTSYYEGVVD